MLGRGRPCSGAHSKWPAKLPLPSSSWMRWTRLQVRLLCVLCINAMLLLLQCSGATLPTICCCCCCITLVLLCQQSAAAAVRPPTVLLCHHCTVSLGHDSMGFCASLPLSTPMNSTVRAQALGSSRLESMCLVFNSYILYFVAVTYVASKCTFEFSASQYASS